MPCVGEGGFSTWRESGSVLFKGGESHSTVLQGKGGGGLPYLGGKPSLPWEGGGGGLPYLGGKPSLPAGGRGRRAALSGRGWRFFCLAKHLALSQLRGAELEAILHHRYEVAVCAVERAQEFLILGVGEKRVQSGLNSAEASAKECSPKP